MVILRQITPGKPEFNQCLGDKYHKITRNHDEEDFKNTLKIVGLDEDPNLYGFVDYWTPERMVSHPLYKGTHYYIMTESGKTFDNLTFRL